MPLWNQLAHGVMGHHRKPGTMVTELDERESTKENSPPKEMAASEKEEQDSTKGSKSSKKDKARGE